MSENAMGYSNNQPEPDADIRILVEYFRDPRNDEWSVKLSTEGMTRGYESEQTAELLTEVLETIEAGGIDFGN